MRLALIITLIAAPALHPHHPQDGADRTPRSPGRVVTHLPDHAIALSLPLSDAARHLAVVVSFPEPVTRAMVPWSEEDISIDTDGSEAMIKLLRSVEGDLAFRGRSGALYRFHVSPAAGTGDSYVKVVLPQAEQGERHIPTNAKSGAIELVRAMRLGQVPTDAQVSSAKNAIVFENDAIVVRARFMYSTAAHRGFVFELSNRSKDQPYRIDPSSFAARNLVLVGAREMLVRPGASTRVYLVFWK